MRPRISTESAWLSRPRTVARPARRPQQVEQRADRGGLAGAVGPEEAVDLAGAGPKVEPDRPPGSARS